MELIKDLPEVFEEFAEQRQKSFLAVKELKEKGVPVVGSYCTYFPKEIAMAMGAGCVSLCSTSDETIPEAEKDLPKNLCPLIKSSYGFAKTDKCPFFYFSDVVVGETTCDGKKKMYEYMSEFKDVFIMELPNSQREPGLQLWKGEIIRFKEYLEQKFGVTITEEQIREAVKTENQARRSLKKLYEVMKYDPAPIKGQDLFKVLYGSTFKFDRSLIPGEVDALTAKIEKEYAEGKREEKKPRILITGCPIGGATEKVIRAVEDNGGIVVTFENCSGAKSIDKLEGGEGICPQIRAITAAGIPVCAHVGMTPQSYLAFGGFTVQGKGEAGAARLLKDALAVQEAGAFAVVLECVPPKLAALISRKLDIITIGIGAGGGCDGQVLVYQDMLGITEGQTPKFVKAFAQVGQQMMEAFQAYDSQVKSGAFPAPAQTYAKSDCGDEVLNRLDESQSAPLLSVCSTQ